MANEHWVTTSNKEGFHPSQHGLHQNSSLVSRTCSFMTAVHFVQFLISEHECDEAPLNTQSWRILPTMACPGAFMSADQAPGHPEGRLSPSASMPLMITTASPPPMCWHHLQLSVKHRSGRSKFRVQFVLCKLYSCLTNYTAFPSSLLTLSLATSSLTKGQMLNHPIPRQQPAF